MTVKHLTKSIIRAIITACCEQLSAFQNTYREHEVTTSRHDVSELDFWCGLISKQSSELKGDGLFQLFIFIFVFTNIKGQT